MNRILLFFTFFYFLFCCPVVSAYEIEKYEENIENRFIVSPVKIDLNVKRGESFLQEFTIVNRLGKKTDFELDKEDFIGSDDLEKATVFLGDRVSSGMSARTWLRPDIETFSLDQGERIKINLQINIPEDAESGGHYAAVFASTKGLSNDGKDQVKIISRAGILVLLTVEGEIVQSGELESFQTIGKIFKNGPVDFSTVYKNTGNVHLRPVGDISISNVLGSTISTIPVKQWIVLPNSRRKQDARWEKKWILGKYKANLNLKLEETGEVFSRELVFYAFPWHVALIILIILIVIYLILRKILGRFEFVRKDSIRCE